jgi:urease accessory protein
MAGVCGHLNLGFEYDGLAGRTVMNVREQRPPMQVVRAFPNADGAVLVHLHNLSGGVLGGDQLELAVEVGPRAQAQLTTTGATRLYRSRSDGLAAAQCTRVRVAEEGLLEYVPDAIIPFAGSNYQQHTTIELAPGAGLFWWETVAPGREARGEYFEYQLFQTRLDITTCGKPLALERVRLEPKLRPLSSLARLGPYNHFASFYICRVGVPVGEWLALEAELSELAQTLTRQAEAQWGVSTLRAHGLVVKALARGGRDIASGLPHFWRAAKLKLYGREHIPPRKTY